MSRYFGAAAVLVALSGCVSQEKYNALKLDRDGLAEQLGKSQNDASTARAEADSYKNQLAAIMGQGGNLQGLVTNLQQQNANLQSQLDDLNRRYSDAMSHVGQGAALPPALSNELSAFAAENPDLVEFDAARGIVKFKSDVTFAPGDATLQPKAKDVIDRFASILNSPAATSYELLVAGHTDNTRVVNPRTIAAGHKDNWYLSSHRAISVAQALMSQSVNPQRLGVVGYADQRPIASNASESGKAQNRRVEVLILPTTVRTGGSVAASTPQRQSTKHRGEMNKDSEASGSDLNK
ncbi:MAG TPA: OmpA family protein [Tepidisphaeraceae bacterium]|jgi:chemotaxis protein MotB